MAKLPLKQALESISEQPGFICLKKMPGGTEVSELMNGGRFMRAPKELGRATPRSRTEGPIHPLLTARA